MTTQPNGKIVMAMWLFGINLYICASTKQWLDRDTFKLFYKINITIKGFIDDYMVRKCKLAHKD